MKTKLKVILTAIWRFILLGLLILILGLFVYMLYDGTGWECLETKTVEVTYTDSRDNPAVKVEPRAVCVSYYR